MGKNANYNIEKELKNVQSRMYGTHLEADMVIVSDAIDLIKEARHSIASMKKRYQEGLQVLYKGQDECDDICCPTCGEAVARNDDYDDMRPKHCPECGTKLLY